MTIIKQFKKKKKSENFRHNLQLQIQEKDKKILGDK